jgi:hypothetical protein
VSGSEPAGVARGMMHEVDEILLGKLDDRLPLVGGGPSNQMKPE